MVLQFKHEYSWTNQTNHDYYIHLLILLYGNFTRIKKVIIKDVNKYTFKNMTLDQLQTIKWNDETVILKNQKLFELHGQMTIKLNVVALQDTLLPIIVNKKIDLYESELHHFAFQFIEQNKITRGFYDLIQDKYFLLFDSNVLELDQYGFKLGDAIYFDIDHGFFGLHCFKNWNDIYFQMWKQQKATYLPFETSI